MRPTQAEPERRAVLLLGAGAGALLLSGCTLNNPYDADRTPAAEAVRDLAPDVAVAVQAAALIGNAEQELRSLVGGRAGVGQQLAGLSQAYRAYADALRGAVPEGVEITSAPAAGPSPSTTQGATARPAAVAAARRTATAVHARLTGLALRAESGSLARLLGSMAAGLSQALVALR